jgi:hypothetical protein
LNVLGAECICGFLNVRHDRRAAGRESGDLVDYSGSVDGINTEASSRGAAGSRRTSRCENRSGRRLSNLRQTMVATPLPFLSVGRTPSVQSERGTELPFPGQSPGRRWVGRQKVVGMLAMWDFVGQIRSGGRPAEETWRTQCSESVKMNFVALRTLTEGRHWASRLEWH